MESSVGGEDQQPSGLVAPADLVLADDGLHDRIEPALGGVQVARDLSLFDFSLKIENYDIKT